MLLSLCAIVVTILVVLGTVCICCKSDTKLDELPVFERLEEIDPKTASLSPSARSSHYPSRRTSGRSSPRQMNQLDLPNIQTSAVVENDWSDFSTSPPVDSMDLLSLLDFDELLYELDELPEEEIEELTVADDEQLLRRLSAAAARRVFCNRSELETPSHLLDTQTPDVKDLSLPLHGKEKSSTSNLQNSEVAKSPKDRIQCDSLVKSPFADSMSEILVQNEKLSNSSHRRRKSDLPPISASTLPSPSSTVPSSMLPSSASASSHSAPTPTPAPAPPVSPLELIRSVSQQLQSRRARASQKSLHATTVPISPVDEVLSGSVTPHRVDLTNPPSKPLSLSPSLNLVRNRVQFLLELSKKSPPKPN